MAIARSRTAQGGRRTTRANAAPANDAAARVSIYDEVTQRIIAELEAGPCLGFGHGRASTGSPGLPINASTGRRYSGINILILWGAVIAADYPSRGLLTFRQGLHAGGSVRKRAPVPFLHLRYGISGKRNREQILGKPRWPSESLRAPTSAVQRHVPNWNS